MHRKGRQDKARSKLFGKLAREITVSAKLGLPDPSMNARLRAAVLAARAENMKIIAPPKPENPRTNPASAATAIAAMMRGSARAAAKVALSGRSITALFSSG